MEGGAPSPPGGGGRGARRIPAATERRPPLGTVVRRSVSGYVSARSALQLGCRGSPLHEARHLQRRARAVPRPSSAASPRRRSRPRWRQWNERGMTDRATWRRCGAAGFLGANQPGRVRRRRRRLPLRRHHHGGARRPARACADGLAALRHLLPYLTDLRQRRAEAPLRPGRDPRRHPARPRHDRAGHRLRPRQRADARAPRRRSLRHQRRQDVHLQRPDRRPVHRRLPRPIPTPTRRTAASACSWSRPARPASCKGRKLDKLGLRGQDTSELAFEDCRVPASNLLGAEGQGFKMLMEKLQQERLCIAVGSLASCRRALDDTVDYVKQRHAFGQPIAAFQNTQFKLAELATEVEIGQAFIDKLLAAHVRGDEIVTEVSMAKWWTTDLQKRLTSRVRAAPRRLRLHARVPDRHGLRRRRRAVDLRRHQRDHESDHRPAHGIGVTASRPAHPKAGASSRTPNLLPRSHQPGMSTRSGGARHLPAQFTNRHGGIHHAQQT